VEIVSAGGGDVEQAQKAFSDEWFETQAVRVERVGFRAGRLGMGYNEDEVDAFLDRIVATLRKTTDQPVTPGDVRTATFSTVLFKPGYAIGEVDEFLAELADVIAYRHPA
jgi:DivIVA domain-containing protein